jgi:hypothetical protein
MEVVFIRTWGCLKTAAKLPPLQISEKVRAQERPKD